MPGRPSSPHPYPNETIPCKVHRPFMGHTKGPPESLWHESLPPAWYPAHSMLFVTIKLTRALLTLHAFWSKTGRITWRNTLSLPVSAFNVIANEKEQLLFPIGKWLEDFSKVTERWEGVELRSMVQKNSRRLRHYRSKAYYPMIQDCFWILVTTRLVLSIG